MLIKGRETFALYSGETKNPFFDKLNPDINFGKLSNLSSLIRYPPPQKLHSLFFK